MRPGFARPPQGVEGIPTTAQGLRAGPGSRHGGAESGLRTHASCRRVMATPWAEPTTRKQAENEPACTHKPVLLAWTKLSSIPDKSRFSECGFFARRSKRGHCAPYQNTWFNAVESSRIRPRVFYELQLLSKRPFDTPSRTNLLALWGPDFHNVAHVLVALSASRGAADRLDAGANCGSIQYVTCPVISRTS